MTRNVISITANVECEICKGAGLRQRGAIQIFCYCVKSEGAPPAEVPKTLTETTQFPPFTLTDEKLRREEGDLPKTICTKCELQMVPTGVEPEICTACRAGE